MESNLEWLLETMDVKGGNEDTPVTRDELEQWLRVVISATIKDMR